MKTYSIVLTAGQRLQLSISGSFLHLLTAADPIDVETLDMQGRSVGEKAEAIDSGTWIEMEPGVSFGSVVVSSATAQTIKLAVAFGRAGVFRIAGSVALANQVGGANASKTVTSAEAQLIAANAARKRLEVQNKDSVGRIWLVFGGAAATQALGILIEPGDTWSSGALCPTGEVRAIGDAASNANVVVLEG